MTEERICSPKLCKAASGNTSACPPVVEGLLLAHSGRRNATVPRSCVRQLRGSWAVFGCLGAVLGLPWGCLGASWGVLGTILRREGRQAKNIDFPLVFTMVFASSELLWGSFGGMLDAFFAALGTSWSPSWAILAV